MIGFEAVALRLLKYTKFAPPLYSWTYRHVVVDHQAIQFAHGCPHSGGRFSVLMAVAPSRAPRPLSAKDFVDRADDIAHLVLEGIPFITEHSGVELCRYVVPDPAPQADAFTRELHYLHVYPSGLVDLQWGLKVDETDRSDVALPLNEIVTVLSRMYRISRTPQFAALHRRRRTEKYRRLDWRVGVVPSISPDTRGSIYWKRLTWPGPVPVKRTDQLPSCPQAGFAAEQMQTIGPRRSAAVLFAPALEQLMVRAGYGAIDNCLAEVSAVLDAGAPAQALPATPIEIPAAAGDQ